jgi:hypothetical protein
MGGQITGLPRCTAAQACTVWTDVFCFQVYLLTYQFLVLLATVSVAVVSGFETDEGKQRTQDQEAKGRKYLQDLEEEFNRRANRASLVRWAYATNITEENLKAQVRQCDRLTDVRCEGSTVSPGVTPCRSSPTFRRNMVVKTEPSK